jgi:hypothetical protein
MSVTLFKVQGGAVKRLETSLEIDPEQDIGRGHSTKSLGQTQSSVVSCELDFSAEGCVSSIKWQKHIESALGISGKY